MRGPQCEEEADIMEYAMRTLPDVSDARGTFQARALARLSADGRWEAWLEFVPADEDTSCVHATPIETHQRDRVTAERWMSGLTRVYAEGALARAVPPVSCPDDFRQRLLPELADALR